MKSIKVLLIGLVMVALTGCGSDSPSKIAQEFLTAAYEGKGEKLISYFDIPNASKADKVYVDGKLQAQSESVKEMAEKKGGVKSIETVKEEVRGDIVVVELKVTFKDGTTDDETLSLKKVDGKWKIQLI